MYDCSCIDSTGKLTCLFQIVRRGFAHVALHPRECVLAITRCSEGARLGHVTLFGAAQPCLPMARQRLSSHSDCARRRFVSLPCVVQTPVLECGALENLEVV